MMESLSLTEKRITLTDSQWDIIKDLFDCQRKRRHSIRGIINAVLYVVENDIHWRMLPKNYAPWQTVYYYFDKWRKTGVWQRVLETLPDDIRQKAIASSFITPYPTVDLKVYHPSIQPQRAEIHTSQPHTTQPHTTQFHTTQFHTVEAGSSLTAAQKQERRYAWVLRDFLDANDESPHNQAA